MIIISCNTCSRRNPYECSGKVNEEDCCSVWTDDIFNWITPERRNTARKRFDEVEKLNKNESNKRR